MAVRTGREYKLVKTSPLKLIMKCEVLGCDWHILATRSSTLHPFKVVKYQEHTCEGSQSRYSGKDHPEATIRWILSKVQSSIENNPQVEPSKLVEEVKNRGYNIQISYNKAAKAKEKTLEIMRNWWKDSHPPHHPDICRALKEELERGGSICKLGLNSDGSSFQHFFWVFPACIHALHTHLRPVVYVGIVQLQIGFLMYARGIDGLHFNGELIEVGFALCVTEDANAWDEFLGWLKEFVLPSPQLPFTIVTDFKETVTRAVQKLPGIYHFFCPCDFANFFSKKFKYPKLWTLCFAACYSFSTKVCEKYLQEIKSKNAEAYEWLLSIGSESHWSYSLIGINRSFFPEDFVSFFSEKFNDPNLETLCLKVCQCFSTEQCEEYLQEMKSMNEEAYKWLVSVRSKSRWSIAFSPNKHACADGRGFCADGRGFCADGRGFDYDHFKVMQEKLSIFEIVASSRDMVENYFSERLIEGAEWGIMLPKIVAEDRCHYYEVKSISGEEYRVIGKYSYETYEVDLKEGSCTCTCCESQATDYPCRHAVMTISHENLELRNYITHRWFTADTYRATYEKSMPPPLADISKCLTAVDEVRVPPPKRMRVGRPRKDKSRSTKGPMIR